jgi:hypothetical protein
MPLVPLQTFPWWPDVTGDEQNHRATLRSPQTQSAGKHIYINHYVSFARTHKQQASQVKNYTIYRACQEESAILQENFP